MDNPIRIYTDGACQPNPGQGGWAFILEADGLDPVTRHGQDPNSTNNRMETQAVIEGLRYAIQHFDVGREVLILSDSTYVVNGVNKRRGEVKPCAKNPDLWREIAMLRKGYSVRAEWIKGHNGHRQNERCDKLANARVGLNRPSRGRIGSSSKRELNRTVERRFIRQTRNAYRW